MNVANVALSGIQAAQTRLANSANNIANASTDKFQPQKVELSPLQGGGVKAELIEPKDAQGVVLEQEVVETIAAGYDFKANLKVLKTQNELDKTLLDIKA